MVIMHKFLNSILLAAVVTLSGASQFSLVGASDSQSLLQSRAALVAGFNSNNFDSGKAFLSSDFLAVLDAGNPLDRAAFIAALDESRYDPKGFAFEADASAVRMYDGAAIIAGKGIQKISIQETEYVREVRRSTGRSFLRETMIDSVAEQLVQFTEFWAWHEERWQLVHLQWTAGEKK